VNTEVVWESRRTMTGTASISGRASAKVLLSEPARNQRLCVIWAAKRQWYQALQLLIELAEHL
jgi:hypothetical protein